MKRTGPLFTLLAGLLLALFMLSLNATTGTKPASTYQADPTAAKVSPSPAPTATKASPSASPSRAPAPNADYAGRTDDDSSAVSVSLRDGRAIAYFCDGRDKESWLKGDVGADGSMKLTGGSGSVLNGTLKSRSIRGAVDIGGGHYAFTADKAVKPSGLYRATATVRKARIDGGWIVLSTGAASLGSTARLAVAGRRRTALHRPDPRLAHFRPLVLPHLRSDDMTQGPTRRAVLLATGAAALTAGCGEYGDGSGSSSVSAGSPGSPGQELATTADIPVGVGKIFKDEQVVVTQPKEGEFKAFTSICTHQQCPVANVQGGTINCTCHGSKFDIADGSVANPSATRPLAEKKITVAGNSIRLA